MDRPQLSVVIPTFNRRADLARALDAWGRQEPAELRFEVVVVDDGSDDGTAELLGSWSRERFALRSERQANAGPAAARNRALGLAAGELVLFSGDDIEPSPSLLAEHWRGHRERTDPDLAILGLTRWPDGVPLTATMRHVDGVGGEQFSYGGMVDGSSYDFRHLYTSNVSLPRGLLEREPGGFSTAFPAAAFEDAELGYRLARRGLKIVYRAAAVAFHHHCYDAASFFRRQVRCGEMAAVLWRLRPCLARFTPLVELEWLRLTELGAGVERRDLVARVAAELERWEARAVALAAATDPLPDPPSAPLLEALFRHAYRRGLAGVLLAGEPGRRLAAASFLELLPPAVARFAAAMARDGSPLAEADRRALEGIGTAPCDRRHTPPTAAG